MEPQLKKLCMRLPIETVKKTSFMRILESALLSLTYCTRAQESAPTTMKTNITLHADRRIMLQIGTHAKGTLT
jgi:hypothetical protein